MNLRKFQKKNYEQYLKDEKHLIWKEHGKIGDLAELGLICEEIGEAMNGIRKRKGIKNLREECGDIISRTLSFMSRKGIDAEQALKEIHEKNVKRNRKGLFIEEKNNDH